VANNSHGRPLAWFLLIQLQNLKQKRYDVTPFFKMITFWQQSNSCGSQYANVASIIAVSAFVSFDGSTFLVISERRRVMRRHPIVAVNGGGGGGGECACVKQVVRTYMSEGETIFSEPPRKTGGSGMREWKDLPPTPCVEI